MKDFQCCNDLIQELISDKNGFFRHPMFKPFFTSAHTRLFFSERRFSKDTGAISFKMSIDSNDNFKDTIFLNSIYFQKGSKEYMISVIFHESLHAYITWSCLSFTNELNGVDAKYLIQHFPIHWERLTKKKYPSNADEHVLMTENFIQVMDRSNYQYTNLRLSAPLRQEIAESLTWGGLYETPEWKKQALKSCRMHNIEIWSRNLDATNSAAVGFEHCDTTNFAFFQSLQFQPLCK